MKNKDNEDALNEYLKLIYEICPNLIDLIYPIFKIANTYSCVVDDYLQLDSEHFEYEKMDIYGNLKLIREFIEKVDKDNLEEFDKVVRNGNLDLFYLDENKSNLYETKIEEAICIESEINPILNIPLNGNIYDGASIVHEFYHSTNSDKKDKETREILTELISIYMELRYLQFLEYKGYSNVLNNGLYDRIQSTYVACVNIFFSGSALDVYNSTGDITNKTLKFIEKYKEEYKDEECKELLLDFLEDDDFGDSIFDFYYDTGYLLGGIIGINLIDNTKLNDIKIKYINNNLDKLELNETFKMLDFNINNYMPWINNTISKLEGVLDEKSNSYSRTNRNR